MRLEEEVIRILEGVFSQHWTFEDCTANFAKEKWNSASDKDKQHLMLVVPGANSRIRFSAIQNFKYNSFICARKRIWLASPYFLPDHHSINLLVEAKQNGVDIRILTTSKRSDKKPVYYAYYEHYGKLLKGGVEIY